MLKSTICGTLAASLFVVASLITFSPGGVQAQVSYGESDTQFTRRMTSRLDSIRSRASRMERNLDEEPEAGGDKKDTRRESEGRGWIQSQLEEIQKEARAEQRRLRSRQGANIGSSQQRMLDRRYTEDAVHRLEYQLRALEKELTRLASQD